MVNKRMCTNKILSVSDHGFQQLLYGLYASVLLKLAKISYTFKTCGISSKLKQTIYIKYIMQMHLLMNIWLPQDNFNFRRGHTKDHNFIYITNIRYSDCIEH